MELSKYNKLEKLGFTFWNKRHDDEIQLESYLIGGSAIAICTSSNLDFNLIERERFIRSMAYFLNHDTVEKINTADTPAPYSPVLLNQWLPNAGDVVKSIKKTLRT